MNEYKVSTNDFTHLIKPNQTKWRKHISPESGEKQQKVNKNRNIKKKMVSKL